MVHCTRSLAFQSCWWEGIKVFTRVNLKKAYNHITWGIYGWGCRTTGSLLQVFWSLDNQNKNCVLFLHKVQLVPVVCWTLPGSCAFIERTLRCSPEVKGRVSGLGLVPTFCRWCGSVVVFNVDWVSLQVAPPSLRFSTRKQQNQKL